MEFIRFIFSSVWIWLGFYLLVALILEGVVKTVRAFRPPQAQPPETGKALLPNEQKGGSDEP